MNMVRLPRHLDDLHQLWFYEADEFAFIVMGLFAGVIFDWMITGCIIGSVIASFFKKYKNGKNSGFLIHTCYWIGLFPMKGMFADSVFKRHWYK